MNQTLLFELVIPCWNESENLVSLISQTVSAAQQKGFTSETFQLVLIENGSLDNSFEILTHLKQTSLGAWFRVERLSTNQGYGGGILAGLKSTRALWIGFTHADLQSDPRDAFLAWEECSRFEENKIVKGLRSNRSMRDWIISRGYEVCVGLLWGFWKWDLNAQPKVFHRSLLSDLSNAPKGITFDAFVLCRAQAAHFRAGTIEVKYSKRLKGKSHWANGIFKRLGTFYRVFGELKTAAASLKS